MAGKQYSAVRPFRQTDPKTGADTHFEVNDDFSGTVFPYMLDPEGPDGQGPLIAEKQPTPSASDSSSKEK